MMSACLLGIYTQSLVAALGISSLDPESSTTPDEGIELKSSSPWKCLVRSFVSNGVNVSVNRSTYHPLSAPLLRYLHSPFTTQSQPPPTPLPPRQLDATLPDVRLDSSLLLLPSARRLNVLIPAVNTLKSSVDESSGMFPVSARPMAINGAACPHIIIA